MARKPTKLLWPLATVNNELPAIAGFIRETTKVLRNETTKLSIRSSTEQPVRARSE
jgi:hypothetical protein